MEETGGGGERERARERQRNRGREGAVWALNHSSFRPRRSAEPDSSSKEQLLNTQKFCLLSS